MFLAMLLSVWKSFKIKAIFWKEILWRNVSCVCLHFRLDVNMKMSFSKATFLHFRLFNIKAKNSKQALQQSWSKYLLFQKVLNLNHASIILSGSMLREQLGPGLWQHPGVWAATPPFGWRRGQLRHQTVGDQRCLLYAPRRGPCGPASPSSFCSSPSWGSCSSSAEWNGLLSSATGKTHKDHLSLPRIVPHSESSIHLNFPFTQIFSY